MKYQFLLLLLLNLRFGQSRAESQILKPKITKKKNQIFHISSYIKQRGNLVNQQSLKDCMKIILSIVMATYLIQKITSLIGSRLNKQLVITIKKINKDIVLNLCLLEIFQMIYYHGYFDGISKKCDVYATIMAMIASMIIWVLFCQTIAFQLQSKINQWRTFEDSVKDQQQILDNYIQRIQDNKQNKTEKDQIKYYLIRQNFITPNHIPQVAESFLRPDFNFANYLAFCSQEVLFEIFSFKYTEIIIIGVYFIVLSFIPYLDDDQIEIQFYFSIVSLILFIEISLYLHMKNIYDIIQPKILDPYKIQFKQYRASKFIEQDLDVQNLAPLYASDFKKQRQCNTSKKQIINIQKNLFVFKNPSVVPKLLRQLILTIIVLSIYFFSQFEDYLKITDFKIRSLFIVQFFLILFYMPSCILSKYLIIANVRIQVELLRNQSYINKVIEEQRDKVSDVFLAFYRQLKLKNNCNFEVSRFELRREHLRLIKNAFWKFKNDGSNEIHIKHLTDICHKFGASLDSYELYFLACQSRFNEETETIEYRAFEKGIKKIIYYIREEPFTLSKKILSGITTNLQQPDYISLRDLKFFLQNEDWLQESVQEKIINELSFISHDQDMILIDEISYAIRNNIECNPR